MTAPTLLLALVVLIAQAETRPFYPHRLHRSFGPYFGPYFGAPFAPSFGPTFADPLGRSFGYDFNRFMGSLFDNIFPKQGFPFGPSMYQPNFGYQPKIPIFQDQSNSIFNKKLDFFFRDDEIDDDIDKDIQFKSADDDEDGVHVERKSIDELEAKPGMVTVYRGKDNITNADVTVYKYRPKEPQGMSETGYISKNGPLIVTGFKTFKESSDPDREGQFQTSFTMLTADVQDDNIILGSGEVNEIPSDIEKDEADVPTTTITEQPDA